MTVIDPPAADFATRPTLDHLALLRVRGADARTFLDSQLTRNVPAVGTASLAGYCSPKGRLLASFVVWADDDGVGLLVARDIAEPIAKRLGMYVLRAKATIELVDEATAITGVLAADATQAVWAVAVEGPTTRIRVPDAEGRTRHLAIGPARDELTAQGALWRWLDIRAGIAAITGTTQDRFVPQMLNLEALGGVDFRKGCFPGQEVVARSQYLGKLKRRTALATMEDGDLPTPGTDLFAAGSSDAVGVVVNAERGPDGRIALLAELPVALFAADDLRVGGVTGPALRVETLPYALPDNEVFVRPKL
jgi:folate-binding protein YgfZ